VERKTGYVLVGKLRSRTTREVNRRAIRLIRSQKRPVKTITADNGTEFHDYVATEKATSARFYFATPHHAWERGTNENTNGLLRQYLPKRTSMKNVTQHDSKRIATTANASPTNSMPDPENDWATGHRTPDTGGVL
jgi:IS30 family transposase